MCASNAHTLEPMLKPQQYLYVIIHLHTILHVYANVYIIQSAVPEYFEIMFEPCKCQGFLLIGSG